MILGDDCGVPDKPVMSVVTVSNGLASYTCQDGYALIGESTLQCRGGLWRGTVPHCDGRSYLYYDRYLYILLVVICPDPASPPNGYIEVTNFNGLYKLGTVAKYRCRTGYILWGDTDTR